MPVVTTRVAPSKDVMLELTADELCYLYWKIKTYKISSADIDVTITNAKGSHNFGTSVADLSAVNRSIAGVESDLVCYRPEPELSIQFPTDGNYPESGFYGVSDAGVSSVLFYGAGYNNAPEGVDDAKFGRSGIIGGKYGPFWNELYYNFYSFWSNPGGRLIPNLWYDQSNKKFYWSPSFTMNIWGPNVDSGWSDGGFIPQTLGATIQTSPIATSDFQTGVVKSFEEYESFRYPEQFAPGYANIQKWTENPYAYGVTPSVGTLTFEVMEKKLECPLNLCAYAFLYRPHPSPMPFGEWETRDLMTEWSATANATISEVSSWDYDE